MDSTATLESGRGGARERSPSIDPVSETIGDSSSSPGDVPDSVPPWPRRGLNDALARLGPAHPGAILREPWSQSQALARGDSADSLVSAETAGAGRATGVAPEAAAVDAPTTPDTSADTPLPPPTWPVRRPRTSPLVLEMLKQANATDVVGQQASAPVLAEGDTTGLEIVRALAALDPEAKVPGGRSPPTPSPRAMAVDTSLTIGLDPMDRPPMIIERARAEQQLRLAAAIGPAESGSPIPGLAIGFSLSVVAAAAVYMVIAGG